MPNLESRRYINGTEVVPGALVVYRARSPLDFTVTSICESVDPERWVGVVRFGTHVVIRTSSFSEPAAAGRDAERLLEKRVVALFETPDE